ncbi:hypothetical protein B0H12DRAFT_151796 [Mycena haematopus]|nr:hypothetical protein B0H12DRAFT_151796 [Mycena haematopus]
MPSVEELRERIEEINSNIIRQENLLQHLRRDKSFAQRQLNEAVDPVARLPLEISSEIFLQCLDPFPQRNPGAYRIPMLLLNVCNTWTTIALSTPSLWSTIRINFPCPRGLTQQLMPIWLQRARNCPLSISLRGDFRSMTPHCVPAIIWRHGSHLKELAILHDEGDYESSHDSEEWDPHPDSDTNMLDLFGDAILEPLPLLESLMVRDAEHERGFLAPQILQLLRLAPNLVDCTFDGMSSLYDVNTLSEKPILPTLRLLRFGSSGIPEADIGILPRLSLPGLVALSVGMANSHRLLCFLKQSAPTLKELILGMMVYPPPDSVQLQECLRLIPSLERLEMCAPPSQLLIDFFTALADSPSLLPNLRMLIFDMSFFPTGDSWDCLCESLIQPLLHAFSYRRIELHIDWRLARKPPATVLAAFAELVADGAEIYNTYD